MQTPARPVRARRRAGFRRFALWAFGALFSFVLSVAAWNFVTGLFAAQSGSGLGRLGALLAAAILSALLLALREVGGLLRLGRLDHLRDRAAAARAAGDLARRARCWRRSGGFTPAAPICPGARARLEERQGEVLDADALLGLAETELLAPLDQTVPARDRGGGAAGGHGHRLCAAGAGRCGDGAVGQPADDPPDRRDLWRPLGQFRQPGGCCAGCFGHLAATGAIALADDLIGSVAGGGLLSKLSRRFGEGVVNGALTARVGLAAMEVCRPMPFHAAARPKVTNLISRALAGLFGPRGAAPQGDDGAGSASEKS